MPSQPLVSIIIPTYNRAHLIGETLDSVLAQTYQNWECIVVDDGSTDGTDEVMAAYIAKDARFQYHKRPDTHLPGGNGARNYGFEVSKGEFIQWFDSDDVMQSEFLKSKVFVFNDKLELVICSGKYVKNNLTIIEDIDISVNTNLFKDYVLKSARIFTPSVLFRRSFLIKKPLFSCELLRSQETELFSRLFFELSTCNYKIVNQPLFLYRQHILSKTSNDANYNFYYKSSHFYVHSENLNRGMSLGDPEIAQFCYRKIIVLLTEAIKNKDRRLVLLITDFLDNIFLTHELLKIKLIVFWLSITNYGKYRLKNYLMNFKIRINDGSC